MALGVAVLVVFVVLIVALLAMAIGIYNGLVSLRQQVDRAWANIDVLLKQRFDEIPQIVEVLEQFVGYEQGVIKNLADARKHYGSAENVADKIKASGELSLAFRGIMAIGEGYPELKSNNNFLHLQSRISGLEDSLSDRREQYNETVTNFNTRIEQFPDLFFARMLAYTARALYKVEEREKVRPSLKLNVPGQAR
jgi:LemA protein